jgi:DNA-binding CsgD family transcriptional regulator
MGPAATPVAVSRQTTPEDFTSAPVSGAFGKQPGVKAMDEIISGAWKGHLGRGLAPKELQYLLGTAQGMTAKEIARQFDVAACTVAKRLSCAMFKLGVTRQAAAVAEAMRRQIISPMCFALVALIAMHTMIDDESMRRDRRVPERRTAQVRVFRQAERPTLTA